MGFDYATFSDHVVIPTDIEAKYPYSSTGEFPAGARAERHEQLIEVAFVAAKTTKLRLVTSVMVVPHRPAVLTAKMLSTIDVLSGGRLVLGIGAGWMKEEFEAHPGAPDFAQRGKVTDEYIKAFIELWTKPKPQVCRRARPLRQHRLRRTSRCRSRIRRSGSAAKADRRCAAPRGWAMPGIRSAPTRPIRSTAWRASRPRWRGCAKMTAGGRAQARRGRPHAARHRLRRERPGQGGRRRAAAVLRQAGRHRGRHQGTCATSASAISTSASAARPSTPCWARCSSSARTCCRWFESVGRA